MTCGSVQRRWNFTEQNVGLCGFSLGENTNKIRAHPKISLASKVLSVYGDGNCIRCILLGYDPLTVVHAEVCSQSPKITLVRPTEADPSPKIFQRAWTFTTSQVRSTRQLSQTIYMLKYTTRNLTVHTGHVLKNGHNTGGRAWTADLNFFHLRANFLSFSPEKAYLFETRHEFGSHRDVPRHLPHG